MKNFKKVTAGAVGMLLAAFVGVNVLSSCAERQEAGMGYLSLSFDSTLLRAVETARVTGLPDTNDFILTVNNPDGSVVYSGAYGKAPERIRVKAGSCNVSVRSAAFEKAAFNAPLFGDDCCVVVPAEGAVKVKLNCTQLNCGIRLKIDSRFLTAYPSAVLFVASGRDRLMYSYSERRIAYFNPGNISVILNDKDKESTLLTRALEANEILSLNLEVGSSPSGESEAADGISIQLDTARIWGNEDFVIGSEDNKGESPDKALSVSQAKAKIGAEAVWVKGYIVGGDLSKAEEGISFEPPFKSDTHLALAARATTLSKSSCIAVQLPAGEIREALNLSDNEELLGKSVCLKGDIVESYFGIVGLKNISDFRH